MLMNVPTTPIPGQAHAEVMQVAEGWRAVLWPFDSRDAAEETRRLLATRGIRSDIIEF